MFETMTYLTLYLLKKTNCLCGFIKLSYYLRFSAYFVLFLTTVNEGKSFTRRLDCGDKTLGSVGSIFNNYIAIVAQFYP